MKSSIFRQVSLDRLSSPEQLDQLLVITGARTWFGLAALSGLIVAACVWGIMGRVVTTAAGTGVIIRQGGVLNIVTNGSGIVTKVLVAPGAFVKAHQVIATIDQPQLAEQITLLEKAREEAEMTRDNNLRNDKDAAQLKASANKLEHTNLQVEIRQLEERAQLLNVQIGVEKQLFDKGLVTNQQVLDMKQTLVGVQERIAQDKAQTVHLDAEQFAIASQPDQDDRTQEMRVSELDREIANRRAQLDLAADVESPYDGQVLEVKTAVGSNVAESQPIASIQPRQDNLEVLAYVPSLLSKDVRPGMDAEVSPSNIKREEYGFIRAHIDYVADFPATEAAMMHNFENNALVQALAQSGPVTEIHATLMPDASTPSGFTWSTSMGPATAITSGTICQVDVVTRQQRPIALLFPYLQSKARSLRKPNETWEQPRTSRQPG